jgi:HTH-type transcriptional regulator/antitoxin HigA
LKISIHKIVNETAKEISPIPMPSVCHVFSTTRQKDLAPLFGSESVVSEVLRGKRSLNKHHVQNVSRHFKVSSRSIF